MRSFSRVQALYTTTQQIIFFVASLVYLDSIMLEGYAKLVVWNPALIVTTTVLQFLNQKLAIYGKTVK